MKFTTLIATSILAFSTGVLSENPFPGGNNVARDVYKRSPARSTKAAPACKVKGKKTNGKGKRNNGVQWGLCDVWKQTCPYCRADGTEINVLCSNTSPRCRETPERVGCFYDGIAGTATCGQPNPFE